MARKMKVTIAVAIALVIGLGIVLWCISQPTEAQSGVTKKTVDLAQNGALKNSISKDKQAIKTENSVSKNTNSTSELTYDTAPDSTEKNVNQALESMSTSLSQGDARTPELAPRYNREKPSPEVLADPARYSEYELGETKKVAAVYLSMLSQIPVLRARIDAAKTSGSKSTEEIAEAEEALAKLETLKRDIEKNHPDMLPDTDATPASPTFDSSAE